MATLTGAVTEGGAGRSGVRFDRVAEPQRRAALALLLTGRPRGLDPAVDNFLSFATSQNINLEQLWAALRGDEPLVSALLAPAAGRTAMLFVSPAPRDEDQALVRDLVRTACAAQDPARTRLVQALIEPAQTAEAEALEAAGFLRLAVLIYMERPVERARQPLALEAAIRVLPWTPQRRGDFGRAILASYQHTLDCPGLVGLRDIEDIIDGHLATGVFVPELWMALYHGDEPVGVMLLNLLPQRQAVELVYLGLSPAWRGRGLGKKLVTHGLDLGARHRCASMILAVDEHNTPAFGLYRTLHFTTSAHKLALIRPLPKA